MPLNIQWKFTVGAAAAICACGFLAIFLGCGKRGVSQAEKGDGVVARAGGGFDANRQAAAGVDESELDALEAQGVPRALAERLLVALRAGDTKALIALGKEARMASGGSGGGGGARFEGERGRRAFVARCFDEAAKLGSAEGMMLAGRCAAVGFGVAIDKTKAMDWFVAAGGAGLADGYNAAARLLLEGSSAKVEIDTALALIEKALALGSHEAQYLKGSLMLAQGGDVSAAFELLMQAARADYPDAKYLLAKIYREEKFLPKDDNVAEEWAKYVADTELVTANAYLAIYAVRGESKEAGSMVEAMDRLVDAAGKGSGRAALELASLYTNTGLGYQNREDVATALNYAKRAFELGEPFGAFFAAWSELVLSDYDASMAWLRRGRDANDWRSSYAYQLTVEGGVSLWNAITIATTATLADYKQYGGAAQNSPD